MARRGSIRCSSAARCSPSVRPGQNRLPLPSTSLLHQGSVRPCLYALLLPSDTTDCCCSHPHIDAKKTPFPIEIHRGNGGCAAFAMPYLRLLAPLTRECRVPVTAS